MIILLIIRGRSINVCKKTGMFGNDVINLKLNMTEFKEEVFLGPLTASNGLIINLSPGIIQYLTFG